MLGEQGKCLFAIHAGQCIKQFAVVESIELIEGDIGIRATFQAPRCSESPPRHSREEPVLEWGSRGREPSHKANTVGLARPASFFLLFGQEKETKEKATHPCHAPSESPALLAKPGGGRKLATLKHPPADTSRLGCAARRGRRGKGVYATITVTPAKAGIWNQKGRVGNKLPTLRQLFPLRYGS